METSFGLRLDVLLIGFPFSVAAKIVVKHTEHIGSSVDVPAAVTGNMVLALAAMHNRLIPQLHRHALKLAAGGAVNIDRRNLFHFLDYQIRNVYSVLRAFCVNQAHGLSLLRIWRAAY
jgi:hypothetical protein